MKSFRPAYQQGFAAAQADETAETLAETNKQTKLQELIAKQKEKTDKLIKEGDDRTRYADLAVKLGIVDESLRPALAEMDSADAGVLLSKAVSGEKIDAGDAALLNFSDPSGKALEQFTKASKRNTLTDVTKEPVAPEQPVSPVNPILAAQPAGQPASFGAQQGMLPGTDMFKTGAKLGSIDLTSEGGLRRQKEIESEVAVEKAIATQEGKVSAERQRDYPRVEYKLGLLNRRNASAYKQMQDDIKNTYGIDVPIGRGLDAIAAKAGLKVAELSGFGEYSASAKGLTTEIGTSLMRLSIKARSGQLAESFKKSIKPLSGNIYKDITMLSDSWANAYGEQLAATGIKGQELEDELISAHLNMFAKMSQAYIDQGLIDKPLSGGFTEKEILKYYEPTQAENELVDTNFVAYKQRDPNMTRGKIKKALYRKGLYYGGRV